MRTVSIVCGSVQLAGAVCEYSVWQCGDWPVQSVSIVWQCGDWPVQTVSIVCGSVETGRCGL